MAIVDTLVITLHVLIKSSSVFFSEIVLYWSLAIYMNVFETRCILVKAVYILIKVFTIAQHLACLYTNNYTPVPLGPSLPLLATVLETLPASL